MIIPTEIRVGHLTYSVRELTSDEVEHSEASGLCIIDKLVIAYDPRQPKVLLLETVLHEVSHAVNDFAHLTDKSDEEDHCLRATPVWMMVWRDNPALLNLLQEYADYELS